MTTIVEEAVHVKLLTEHLGADPGAQRIIGVQINDVEYRCILGDSDVVCNMGPGPTNVTVTFICASVEFATDPRYVKAPADGEIASGASG